MDKWTRRTLLVSLPEDFVDKFTGMALFISGPEEH